MPQRTEQAEQLPLIERPVSWSELGDLSVRTDEIDQRIEAATAELKGLKEERKELANEWAVARQRIRIARQQEAMRLVSDGLRNRAVPAGTDAETGESRDF